jgi:hypothetical protein
MIGTSDVLARRVADARKGFASNDSQAFHKRIVVPELSSRLRKEDRYSLDYGVD